MSSEKITFQRNLICLEDLNLGSGSVTQVRGTTSTILTKINASNFPYDDDFSIKEKIDSLDNTLYVDVNNLPVYIATPRDASSLNLVDVIWIKEISSTEWHVYYYDTIMFKFNPDTGDLILDSSLFDASVADLTSAYEAADDDVATAMTALINAETTARAASEAQIALDYVAADLALVSSLELGTASRLDAGTSALNVIQLDNSAKLPAVDGSLLTNLPVATAPAGSVVQRTVDESTAVTSYSSLIPRAGSAPAITEGTQLFSRSFTPSATGNKILIKFRGSIHPSALGVAGAALLFVDGTFVRGDYARASINGTTYPLALTIEYEHTAASTSPVAIELRVGPAITAGSIQFNDNSWGSSGKGVTMVIEEVKV